MSNIAIFGATSEIGEHIARLLAPGQSFLLAGRRPEALETLAEAAASGSPSPVAAKRTTGKSPTS